MHTLTVKILEYGVLKIHAHCTGILCINQNWFSMHSVQNERIVGTLLSEETGGEDIFSIIYDVCGIFEKLKIKNKMHGL
jgi:hypothetical protein